MYPVRCGGIMLFLTNDWSDAGMKTFAINIGFDDEFACAYSDLLHRPRNQCDSGSVDDILALADRHLAKPTRGEEAATRQKQILTVALTHLSARGQLSKAARDEISAFMSAHCLSLPESSDVTLPNSAVFRCYLNEYIQLTMWLTGEYEPVEAFLIESIISPKMLFFDVGANIGQHTVVLGRAARFDGVIHAFEPSVLNYARLVDNVHRNKLDSVCQLNNCAVWDRRERLNVKLAEEHQGWCNNNGGFFVQRPLHHGCGSIEAIDLSSYCEARNIRQIDLMKIDVEGSEYRALCGASQILEKGSPVIIMEVNRSALIRMGNSVEELSCLVRDLRLNVVELGASAAECRKCDDLNNLEFANILLYRGALPHIFESDWDQFTVDRWMRSKT
jgi:FkbM family methyltransferase